MLHLCLTSFIKCMKAFNIHTHTENEHVSDLHAVWVTPLNQRAFWTATFLYTRHPSDCAGILPPPPLNVLLWWRSTFMEKERRREGSHPVSVDRFPAEASLKQLQLIYGAMTAWLSHYGASISFLFPVTHTLTVGSLVSTDRHDGRTQHRHNFSFCWFSGFQ